MISLNDIFEWYLQYWSLGYTFEKAHSSVNFQSCNSQLLNRKVKYKGSWNSLLRKLWIFCGTVSRLSMPSMVSTTEFSESIKLDKSRFAQLVRVRFVQRESLCLVMIRHSECHTQQDEETKKKWVRKYNQETHLSASNWLLECFDGQWRFEIKILDDFGSQRLWCFLDSKTWRLILARFDKKLCKFRRLGNRTKFIANNII